MGHELRTERELSLDFLRVTEAAAIAAARTMGQGDRKFSDHVAVEAMREVMDTVPMRGRVVIEDGKYVGRAGDGQFVVTNTPATGLRAHRARTGPAREPCCQLPLTGSLISLLPAHSHSTEGFSR